MKKAIKAILWSVLALVVILVVLVLAHPLWIGPVARTAVSQLAPKFLGVPAHLDGFSLNAYTGRVTLDGFALDNPPGCREAKFVTVGHLCVDVDPLSLASEVVTVEEISLKDLYVSIMSDERKVYNYETVSEACASSGKKAEKPAEKPEEKKPADGKGEKKLIIDLLQVETALVQWERLSLPLPSFRLTGIGRGANGLTAEASWKEIETQFIGALGPLAKGLQALLDGTNGSVNKGLNVGLQATQEVSKSVGDAQKALSDVSKALNDGSAESAEAAAKSVDSAVKSVEGSVKQFKSLFGK